MRASVLLALVVLAGCGPRTPDGVAREFLKESAAGNWVSVRGMVVDACADGPVARGGPVQVGAAFVRPDRVDVRVVEQTETTATVEYEIEGIASSGADVDVRGGGLAEETRQRTPSVRRGNLVMVNEDGHWRVSCP